MFGIVAQIWIARRNKWTCLAAVVFTAVLLITYLAVQENLVPSYRRSFPVPWRRWIPALIMAWGVVTTIVAVLLTIRDRIPAFRSERRHFLRMSTAAIAAVPASVATFGILTRKNFHVHELDCKIPGLPKDLQNLRLAQLSDIHMGLFFSERDL